MDELIKKVSALGVPGIILIVAVKLSGFYEAAAVTFALSSLGGPFGMLGGIATLWLISLITHTIAEYGFEAVNKAVVNEQLKTKTAEETIAEVNGYPISKGLKLKIIDYILRVSSFD